MASSERFRMGGRQSICIKLGNAWLKRRRPSSTLSSLPSFRIPGVRKGIGFGVRGAIGAIQIATTGPSLEERARMRVQPLEPARQQSLQTSLIQRRYLPAIWDHHGRGIRPGARARVPPPPPIRLRHGSSGRANLSLLHHRLEQLLPGHPANEAHSISYIQGVGDVL